MCRLQNIMGSFRMTIIEVFLFTIVINIAWVQNVGAIENIPVFEAMRLSMTDNPEVGLPEFFSDSAITDWNDNVATVFSRAQTKYFFAFSVIMPVKQTEDSAEFVL